jgi:hypothetical protein
MSTKIGFGRLLLYVDSFDPAKRAQAGSKDLYSCERNFALHVDLALNYKF